MSADFDIPACDAFVEDISAFVDHELEGDRATRLTDHIRACPGCGDYAEGLRKLSEIHRRSATAVDEGALEARIDPKGLFRGITSVLVSEKQGTLARLFYEIGRAYVIVGNRELSEANRRSVVVHTPTLDIRGNEERAKRMLRQADQLQERAAPARRSLFKQSRRLFERGRRERSGALERGRHFLEEALALEPGLDEARLYLGFQFSVTGRFERARVEFRKVYAGDGLPVHKLMALQSLGSVYEMCNDYMRAAECYAQVVSDEAAGVEPRLFPSFLNLPVSCAKAGRSGDSVRHFETLVQRFPQRVAQIRGLLSRKQSFAATLAQNAGLLDDLRRAVPQLFAA
ncbi:MAG: zf-HC2 domain-containing protein [Planctomycetes bacterium]|nr:zf-HC2 domain-containing protein [Planctomycetota bacterium]